MRRPLIGVTTYHRERSGRERFHVPAAYVDAVRQGGGLPVLLPPGDPRPGEILASLDGLVLCGGGDIDPALFGGASGHAALYATCAERDGFELALVRDALARRTPMLAICRGLQVLNVALGGDLHLHLPDVVGDRVAHRVSREEHGLHPVRIDAGCGLAAVLGSGEIEVATWHHQAIDRLGEDLRPVAWAADGTIEAVELPGHPEVLAVQWHPELQARDPASRQGRLFEALVERARGAAPVAPGGRRGAGGAGPG
ncbi:MAG: gamma-glutamyl-gamma-aminobutyrate hydrolase family protein [Deltaproteobacteria bacterium]|nr:gamma-glutamyl-gamma-aminobutyrate hydrolase family protein [Deltaproteobacteria bacterium]